MVAEQIAARGIREPRVLEAMRRVPRHEFVERRDLALAHQDGPLPIGLGQTISQPYMVALMTELCALAGGERVLEIGAGSGYQSAVLAELCAEVYAVERHAELVERARQRLARLGYHNIHLECFDGTVGWPEHAPYDAVLVAAATRTVPPLLLDQLGEGGRLVMPVGDRGLQQLVRVVRHGASYEQSLSVHCRFVDLVGRYGWGGDGAALA
jgi:protein-L-isoaspartate(D-aspartate) O-methyltransferase